MKTMVLKILGSSSSGNSYLLENDSEVLMIEAGIHMNKVKKALNYDISKVAGCLSTHSHRDHSGYIKDVIKCGIDVYSSSHCFESYGLKSHRAYVLPIQKKVNIGGFKVLAFEVPHDVPNLGFLIDHKDCGRILFLTDTYLSPFTFPGLSHIICETNYAQDILDHNTESGRLHSRVRGRVLNSHMDISTFKDILKANDLSSVREIVLIHLSDGNSNAKRFQEEIIQLTGKNVHVADSGMVIDMSKNPF